MASIRRDFLPADLKVVLEENQVDGCVAVQADQSLAETDFLLELSKANDFIKGVVGWVDLSDKNVHSVLEKYSNESKLKGFRHIVQSEKDHNFLLRHDFLRGISLLEKYRYTYDILVFPHQLGAVLEFVRRFPEQRFVIDHMAKPYIKDGFYDGWAVMMHEIARQENVYCKLSGAITEADYATWSAEQLHPYLHTVLEVFGSERVMFGSDWPVCLVAGKYNEVKKVVVDFISGLSQQDKNLIMGENAKAFYDL